MSKKLVSIAFVHIPLEQPVKFGKGRLAGLLLCSASNQRYNQSANGTTLIDHRRLQCCSAFIVVGMF